MNTQQTGRISVHPRGFGFVSFDDGSSAFVPPPDLNRFLADDVVRCAVDVKPDPRGDKLSARDLALVTRARTRLFGTALTRNGKRFLKVDRVVANTDWPLDGDVPDGAELIAAIDGERAQLVAVVSGARAETEKVLCRHNLRGDAEGDIERAAHAAPALVIDAARRRDLRAQVCVTIDGPSTRDIDDALLAYPPDGDGAVRVVVAIADVSSVVMDNSALDLDARARSTSVYLPGRVVPMLPRALSEDRLSLVEAQERHALTAELRIDPEGRVLAVDVHEAVIRSTARLTYDAVASFLDNGVADAVPATTHQTLLVLRTAAARLSQARAERGGVDVERDEISLALDPSGAPTGLEVRANNSAHVLVERLMVAANEAVARWLVERGLPGVYRVHDAPTLERTQALEETARALGIVAGFSPHAPLTPKALRAFDRQVAGTTHERAVETALRRLLGPARYTTRPGMHFGLAAPLYLHFTSPIRRYADLLVHRIVKGYLNGARGAAVHAPELEAICQHINDVTHRASRAEAERERALVARLFARRIGESVTGVVIGHKPQGALVQLGGAVGLLPSSTAPLGAQLQVVIDSVDEELGRIDLR